MLLFDSDKGLPHISFGLDFKFKNTSLQKIVCSVINRNPFCVYHLNGKGSHLHLPHTK